MRDSTKIKRAVKKAIPDAQNVRAYQRRGSSFWHVNLAVPKPPGQCTCDREPNNWQSCFSCNKLSGDFQRKAEQAVRDSGAFYSNYYPDDGCYQAVSSIIVDVTFIDNNHQTRRGSDQKKEPRDMDQGPARIERLVPESSQGR